MYLIQRNTYTSRIKELERLDLTTQQASGDKALPDRPLSDHSLAPTPSQSLRETENQDATPTQENNFPHENDTETSLPDRRRSLRPSAFGDSNTNAPNSGAGQEESFSTTHLVLDDGHFSEPFSPFDPPEDFKRHSDVVPANSELYELAAAKGPEPANGTDPTSWLDTIDESGASSPTSAKSKLSMYSRTTGSRQESNGTEAEFDAALDAAVEAAYNEGLEPADRSLENTYDNGDDVVSNARRNIEIAKQRVREAEREAQEAMARGFEQRRMMDESAWSHDNSMDLDYVGEEAEEEERILEEMTKGYVMDDFDLDLHTKSALPRQSDSSNFSGRTWGSSVTSNPATAITSLSTLAEETSLPTGAAAMAGKLPTVPQEQTAPLSPPSGVRARRLSGANLKQLKIDTNRTQGHFPGPKTEPFAAPFRSPPPPTPQYEPLPSVPMPPPPNTSKPLPSVVPDKRTSNESLKEDGYGTGLSRAVTQESDDFNHSLLSSPPRPFGKTPSAPGILRKNTSSSSLGMMARNGSVSTPDILNESPNTPSSSTFPQLDFQRAVPNSFVPPSPTPTGAAFANGLPRGFYLFDNDIHSPTTPGAPNQSAANAPLPLEPCPGSYLHRPFWLMRSLYQTIAHPRGGYLSTKLFVPREVWLVKNVKIRAMEDKISLCDLLTAALLKLAQVDTYDADAVLEEMQSFENMLDQAQSSFSKKLGNEVGVQTSLPLFKSPTTTEEPSVMAENSIPRSSNSTSKSYLASWRKLRSKSSGTTSGSHTPVPLSGRDSGKEGLTMNTLPMTMSPSTRTIKRNVVQLQFTGPNANYMGALARLFDAAQVLGNSSFFLLSFVDTNSRPDQIVRQVEDPGLKHSSPTHVGLELSTRHAAEFFGFYVCRFALTDLGLLLDKYIKRGSEWVSL